MKLSLQNALQITSMKTSFRMRKECAVRLGALPKCSFQERLNDRQNQIYRHYQQVVIMAKYNRTKQEWKNALIFSKKVSLFPDAPEPGNKEYIAGYTTALHKNSMIDCAEAEKDRNRIVKELRADGWQTWTEPGASIGGLGTKEYSFSAMRTKEVV